MSRPLFRVNNFLQNNFRNEASIDIISKVFIIGDLPLGINRLPLLRNVNTILIVASVAYSTALVCFSIYCLTFIESPRFLHVLTVSMSAIQIIFYAFFNFLSRQRLIRYYNELNNFDNQVCCKPKIGYSSIRNIAQMIVTILYVIALFYVPFIIPRVISFHPRLLPVIFAHIIELHYYGHLISLLVPRLRLINYYMRLSICPNDNELSGRNSANYSLCQMEKLMNLYHIVIKAYGFFIEAIKWQLLITLIASFIHLLCTCYNVAHSLIRGGGDAIMLVMFFGKLIGIMLPLFAPCTLADQVHNEVKRLRELLASRLYENRLDKCSRGVARALLAWTKTRDLSFSLLRMLRIDISLPFKFVGLLATYLIILLQFEKVINP